MKKKLMAILGVAAAMCLCFALVGCGGSSSSSSSSASASDESADTVEFVVGFDSGFPQDPGSLAHFCRVCSAQHKALIIHSLVNFYPIVPGHQRMNLIPLKIIEIGPLLASDLQKIPETARGDQTSSGTARLQNGIGSDSGSVHEAGNVGTGEAMSVLDDLYPFDDCRRLVVK